MNNNGTKEVGIDVNKPKVEIDFQSGKPKSDNVVRFGSDGNTSDMVALSKQDQQIDSVYGFIGEYSYEADVSGLKDDLSVSAMRMLAAGCRLIRIKEHEEHGKFVFALEAVGIEPRMANRFMNAAAKFVNDKGAVKYQRLAQLGVSKIYDLAMEDDELLKELEEGRTVAGLKLADVDKMSVRELRAKLRDIKKDKAASEELVRQKNAKIDELEKKLIAMEAEGKPAVDWSARSAEILSELNKILMEASQLNGRLNALVDEVHGMQETEWTKEESVCLQQAKFVASTISDDASVTVDRLDWLAPKVNAAFFPGLNFNRGHADEADDADYTVVDGEGEDA